MFVANSISGFYFNYHQFISVLEADLVVVGATARSGITALIVESTAEILAKDLNCSVLVVKPPGFVTPIVVDEP